MKISDAQVKAAEEIASDVFDKQLSVKEGAELLTSLHGLNVSSARDFINDYKYMMHGRLFQRAMSAPAIDYFLTRIRINRGDNYHSLALSAVDQHIYYYEGLTGVTLHKMRAIADAHRSLTGLRMEDHIGTFNEAVKESTTQLRNEGRIFGHIIGIDEGTTFASYEEMNKAKIHVQTQAGISGSQNEGADSIIISGGYEDDQDYWDTIVYTGQGGQNSSGKHIADQKLTRGNLALVKSELEGLPVRVIRGKDRHNPYAPTIGYRYDGLYRVDSHWSETGKSGFLVWRYRLLKIEADIQPSAGPIAGGALTIGTNIYPMRKTMIVQRIVRDTKEGKKVKQLYEWTCQVCGIQIATSGGYYAEAAHVRALGAPHNGPDTSDNIICLCPNHHVMFDKGAFAINDDMSFIGITGSLIVSKKHTLSIAHIKYHREHFLVEKLLNKNIYRITNCYLKSEKTVYNYRSGIAVLNGNLPFRLESKMCKEIGKGIV